MPVASKKMLRVSCRLGCNLEMESLGSDISMVASAASMAWDATYTH